MIKYFTRAMTFSAASALLMISCGKEPQTQAKEETKPKTHFDKVTSHLDTGGDYFSYSKVDPIRPLVKDAIEFIKSITSSEEIISAVQQAQISEALDLGDELFADLGLYDIDATASSSLKVKDSYHNKSIIHAKNVDGSLFKLLGGKAHALDSQLFLPKNTMLAISGDLKLDALWKSLSKVASKSTIPEVKNAASMAEGFLGLQGIDLKKVLAEQSGEIGFFVTADPSQRVTRRFGNDELSIPPVSLNLIIARKGDTINGLINDNLPSSLKKTTVGEFDIISAPGPMPPLQTTPAMAIGKDFILISSDKEVLKGSLEAFSAQSGLVSTEEFKNASAKIPDSGNSYCYLSPRVAPLVVDLIKTETKGKRDRRMAASFLAKVPDNIFFYGVGQIKSEGIFSTYNCNFRPDRLSGGPLMAVTSTAIISAMLFPTFGKMQRAALAHNQMNNAELIGLNIADHFTDVRKKTVPHSLKDLGVGSFTSHSTFNKSGIPTHGENGDVVIAAAGKRWIDVNNSETVLAYIDYPNKDDKISIVFGDGHAETWLGTIEEYYSTYPNSRP